jgi:hypothetical protein
LVATESHDRCCCCHVWLLTRYVSPHATRTVMTRSLRQATEMYRGYRISNNVCIADSTERKSSYRSINDAGIRDGRRKISPRHTRCFRRVALASYLPPLGAPAINARVNNVTVEAVARLCDTHLCNHLAKATLQVVRNRYSEISKRRPNHGNTQHSFFQSRQVECKCNSNDGMKFGKCKREPTNDKQRFSWPVWALSLRRR